MKSQEHDLKAEWTGIITHCLEKNSCWGFEGNLSCQGDQHFCYLCCICLLQNVRSMRLSFKTQISTIHALKSSLGSDIW